MTTPNSSYITNLHERNGVIVALGVLEAIQTETLTPEACAEWISRSFGRNVDTLSERGVGAVTVHEPPSAARTARFRQICEAARREVVRVMRGLLAKPQDDAFVSKALYEQRVKRETQGSKVVWVASPAPTTTLSGYVLLMFVVDILGYRDTYDSRLSICDECDRISFVERRGVRFGCPYHPVG
jgi:hypothetical protein